MPPSDFIFESLSPVRLVIEFLNSRIKGQWEAKNNLALALELHVMNCRNSEYPKKKVNSLITGPSGSGKSAIAEALADYLELPFINVDCSRLSSAGYKGSSIEDAISLAVSSYSCTHEIDRGILFLDEIDKLSMKSLPDNAGDKIQCELLKIIDGCDIMTPIGLISTKNMMIIAAGSFTELRELEESSKRRSISMQDNPDSGPKTVSQYDLLDFGFKKELLGRLHNHVEMEGLSIEDMADLIREKELPSLLSQVAHYDVILPFAQSEILEVAKQVISLGLGARGARSLLYSRINRRLLALNSNAELLSRKMLLERYKLSGVPYKKIVFPKDFVILNHGDIVDSLYLIVSGPIVCVTNERIDYLSEGVCVNGRSAFQGASSRCSVVAQGDIIAFEFKVRDIKSNLSCEDFFILHQQLQSSSREFMEAIEIANDIIDAKRIKGQKRILKTKKRAS